MNSAFPLMLLPLAGATENEFLRAVLQSGPFARFIMLIIGILSVLSWAVIFYKISQYRRIHRENSIFLRIFPEMGGDFGGLSQKSAQLPSGSIPRLFGESYQELRSVSPMSGQQMLFERAHLQIVQRRMERVVGHEIIRLERYLVFLATTANVAPFLGLLGTVWGVLGTFMSMTQMDTALTLRVIGPGISEALTTTILGLAAAIPAVIAYNFLVSRVAVFRMEMEDFAIRLLALLEKNILARSTSKNDEASDHRSHKPSGMTVARQVGFK